MYLQIRSPDVIGTRLKMVFLHTHMVLLKGLELSPPSLPWEDPQRLCSPFIWLWFTRPSEVGSERPSWFFLSSFPSINSKQPQMCDWPENQPPDAEMFQATNWNQLLIVQCLILLSHKKRFTPPFFCLAAKVLRAAEVTGMLTDSNFTRSLTSEVVFPASYRGQRSEGTHDFALGYVSAHLRIKKKKKTLQFVACCGYIVPSEITQGGIKRSCSKEEWRHGPTFANMEQIKTTERVLEQATEKKDIWNQGGA